MRITDEADCEDVAIHGRVMLEPVDGTDTAFLETTVIAELRRYYKKLLKEFPALKISLNETNFKERWIDYSLETEDQNMVPVNAWKRNQKVGLIPTPESKAGADIY